jgi:hypothetical protein
MKVSAQLLVVAPLGAVPGSTQDFRQSSWGTTKAQVLASEVKHPNDVHESNGELVVQYDGMAFRGLDGSVVYIFAKDKLVRAKYLLDAEHSELNDFIADYRAIEAAPANH